MSQEFFNKEISKLNESAKKTEKDCLERMKNNPFSAATFKVQDSYIVAVAIQKYFDTYKEIGYEKFSSYIKKQYVQYSGAYVRDERDIQAKITARAALIILEECFMEFSLYEIIREK